MAPIERNERRAGPECLTYARHSRRLAIGDTEPIYGYSDRGRRPSLMDGHPRSEQVPHQRVKLMRGDVAKREVHIAPIPFDRNVDMSGLRGEIPWPEGDPFRVLGHRERLHLQDWELARRKMIGGIPERFRLNVRLAYPVIDAACRRRF